ncbi:hypothetical protein OSTOST_06565 [Ostertagia ostertagi]
MPSGDVLQATLKVVFVSAFCLICLEHKNGTQMAVIVFLLPSVFCQGGMAELKAITGDEPYSGPGPNAPMPVPRPMGFWGRPRYSPVGYYGGYGGASPYYGQGGRYNSISYSPYGEDGQLPFEGPSYNPRYNFATDNVLDPSTLLLSLLGGRSYSPYSRSSLSSPFRTPYQPFLSSSNSPSSFHTAFHPESSFSPSDSPSPFNSASRSDPFPHTEFGQAAPSSSDSFSLSSALGGIYKGKGNEMIGR